MRERIDPDTGYTPSQQAAKWEEWMQELSKPTKTKQKRTIAKGPTLIDKKARCVELLSSGLSVSQVAKDLGITYANVNYYKRFVK